MRNVLKHLFYIVYYPVSFIWRKLDGIGSWKETKWWIDHVPNGIFTSATYASYAGWIQNQGIFAALLSLYLKKDKPNILDFGCGMGNLAPVAYYFVRNGGSFLGIDTDANSIAACQKTYKDLKNCEFYQTRDPNAWYPQDGVQPTKPGEIDWRVKNNSQDLVTAMSVFTHLQEKAAIEYRNKMHEVLVHDGLAIVSFLIVRDYLNPNNDIYNYTHELTPGWFTPSPACPERSIGIKYSALLKLLDGKFKILGHIEGCVTGGKHPSLQDLLILQRI